MLLHFPSAMYRIALSSSQAGTVAVRVSPRCSYFMGTDVTFGSSENTWSLIANQLDWQPLEEVVGRKTTLFCRAG